MAFPTVNDSVDGSFLPHRRTVDLSTDEIVNLIRWHGRLVAATAEHVATPGGDDVRELRKEIARLADLADLFEEAIAPQS